MNQKFLSWVGMLTTVAGSYSMSFGFLCTGFALLFVGSCAWFYCGIRSRDWAMVSMQGVLFISEIQGIVRNYG